jgi:FAD/FMN-containing dehydrogenase
MEALREGALKSIEEIFGDRLKRRPPGTARAASDGALASVFPTSAEEVALLTRTAERYSVSLTALGAETHPEAPPKGGEILVRFDLHAGPQAVRIG